jgi:membrane protease YdiL (CAAX protease family)
MAENSHERRTVVSLAALFEGGLVVLALALDWARGGSICRQLQPDFRNLSLGVIACLPMLALFLVCIRWPVGPLASILEFTRNVILPMFRPCTFLDLAVICVLAGFGEEMLFRGVIQDGLTRWMGTWWALVLAGIIFGLVHSITPSYVVLAAMIGCYLGWIYLLQANLIAVVVAHALYDFVALVFLTRIWRPAPDGQ